MKRSKAPLHQGLEAVIDTVPPRVAERLEKFVFLLEEWSHVTNLLSRQTLPEIWTRHVQNCLQFVRLAPTARRWLDVGSGAGFPGIVIAIQLADDPGARIHLVDADGRKCVFLREVARELALPVNVHHCRIETLRIAEVLPIEIVTTRAFASLEQTLLLLKPLLSAGATALLARGKSAPTELDELAVNCYAATCVSTPTGGGGYILSIKNRT